MQGVDGEGLEAVVPAGVCSAVPPPCCCCQGRRGSKFSRLYSVESCSCAPSMVSA